MSVSFNALNAELRLKDKITFGKYNGSFVQDVIDNDPKNMLGLLANTNNKLSKEAQKELANAVLDILAHLQPPKSVKTPKLFEPFNEDEQKIPF